MNNVRDHSLSEKDTAIDWLEKLPRPFRKPRLADFPDGPIFKCDSAATAVDFLLKCAAFEDSQHRQDEDMEDVILTIQIEYGTRHSKRLELMFGLSGSDQEGSVLYSLSTAKCPDRTFQIFGDDDYRHLA